MRSLSKMKSLVKSGKTKFLTLEAARNLKGKRIQTIYFGFRGQDGSSEFVVGDIISEWDYFLNLKEDCFPDEKGHKNRTEYWQSWMTEEQIKRTKEELLLLTENGEDTYIRYIPDFENGHRMTCGDADRDVSYVISKSKRKDFINI